MLDRVSLLVMAATLLQVSAAPAEAQASRVSKVDFGVAGHPLVPGSYADVPIDRQISRIKALGLKVYRVDVNPSRPDKFAQLSHLVAIAERAGIRVLPVVVLSPKQYSDETTAYDTARQSVARLAAQFDKRISIWELGNEYDLYCVNPGADGGSPADYDTQKYRVVRGLLKGMLAGLHESSPSSRSIIETSQHTPRTLDSGFLQKLIADGVSYDITGYHFYSGDGRVPVAGNGMNALRVLHDDFRRPIWITEFDKAASSRMIGPDADPRAQGEALRVAMAEIGANADRYDVAIGIIYELLDEPNLLKNPQVSPAQAQFGILDAHGDGTAASTAVREFLQSHER